jgi:sirohydrochlorin cobaltochelatase
MAPHTSEQTNSAHGDQDQLARLEAKINAILPPQYVGCFEDVAPASMGSANLKFDADGRVAWGEIWTTFCHLALAGGPPHRGTLLEAVTGAEAEARPSELCSVRVEIERAIGLTTELKVMASPHPGWIAVRCHDEDMAAWLVRAIVAENIIARHEREVLFLPVGPDFRVEKEIKNVVVSLAKACHYLLDHVEPECRPSGLSGDLAEPPLRDDIAASPAEFQLAALALQKDIHQLTGLEASAASSPAWIGVKCASEEMAVWMQRAIIVEDVLARREDDVVCVPVSLNQPPRPGHEKVVATVAEANRLWLVHATSARGK